MFVQQQKRAVAMEIKAVLDGWVCYEQQLKESEQAELTKNVIDKVLASISKTLCEVLLSAFAEANHELYIGFHIQDNRIDEQGYLGIWYT